MTAYTNVLSELRIGGATLPNRIVRTAHVTGLGLDAPSGISERFISYHEARARGGVGLSILEISSGHPSSPGPIMATNPALVEGYQQLVERIRPHGMRMFQQIWHGGHNARQLDGGAPWSASDIPSPLIGIAARPMTKLMIDEVIEGFVLAACVAKQGGIDGVEVHAAHGYLIQQFLSPLTNKRDDDYGGSFDNRMRLLVEVLTAVRNEVGEGFPVGVRVGPQMVDGGFDVDDCIQLVTELEAQGLADFIDISQGSYFNIPKIVGAMHEPTGYQLDHSAKISVAASKPTIVTGRFRTLEEAEQIIRQGLADCVSMVRATIAEPELVRKTVEGREAEARPCIGCNQACIGNQMKGILQISCTVNPAVGLEKSISEAAFGQADSKKNVLVIGGGPAGMEAARVAAIRGHNVTLCEADKELGGKLRLARKAPSRLTIGDISNWLENEIYRLGVNVQLNTYLDESEVDTYSPDVVVCATGAWPREDGFQLGNPGHPLSDSGLAHLTSFDIFSQSPSPDDGPFLIDDDLGHYEGIAVAEYLLQEGAEVIYVTRHAGLAPLMEPALSARPAFARLSGYDGFQLYTQASVAGVDKGHVLIKTGDKTVTVNTAAVVLVTHDSPSYELLESVEAKGIDCQIIGDARSPRFLETAIREGRQAGLAV